MPDQKAFSLSLWINPSINKTYQTIISQGTGRRIYTDSNNWDIRFNYFGNDYIIYNGIDNGSWSNIGITLNDEGVLTTYFHGTKQNTYTLPLTTAQGDIML